MAVDWKNEQIWNNQSGKGISLLYSLQYSAFVIQLVKSVLEKQALNENLQHQV